MSARVLLIDDDASGRNALRRALVKQGYEVQAHASGPPALSLLSKGERFDLVITDLKMPDMDGLELLAKVREQDPGLPVILITGFGTIETAVEAMQLGARDYLTKPLDLFEVRTKVEKALQSSRLAAENQRLARENRRLRRRVPELSGLAALIGEDPGLELIKKKILQVAPAGSSVLIIGESGTGKELIAHAIHHESGRRDRPFLPINCAAIPPDILESELFGHERGAFTGAVSRKPGKFELAAGGTLFLDEIGELPLAMQAKLLRVLEEKAFMRVGGVETVHVDVRIAAATNADLEHRVEEHSFRTDLYYRLKVVTLEIPPLRARRGDLPLLVRHFLDRLGEEYHRPDLKMSRAAMGILARQLWPGNVRELRNLLESMVVLTDAPLLDVADFPSEYTREVREVPVSAVEGGSDRSMAEMEKRHIMKVLKEQNHNRTRAARVLGIGRRTLQRKLDEYREQGDEIPPAASE